PEVHAADVGPRILGPSVVAELAGVRNRMERPHEFAGEHVERPQIAGGRAIALAGRGAEDDQILEDAAGRARLNAAGARDAVAQIDAAVLAEGVDGDAGARVDMREVGVRRGDE